MIRVKAPQVSYDNEIIELVKVFFPEDRITGIDKDRVQTKKFTTELDKTVESGQGSSGDMVLETGYFVEDKDLFSFYAFLWAGDDLLFQHKASSPMESVQDIVLSNTEIENEVIIAKSHEEKIQPASLISDNKNGNTNTTHYKKSNRFIKNGIKGCVFDLLVKATGKHPKWGAMTGIRPVKLVHEMLDRGLKEASVKQELLKVYKLRPEKASLLMRTAQTQRPLIDDRRNNNVTVYIHIPFCSSRCLYCSFPSDLISRVAGKMNAYLECLEQEMTAVLNGLQKQGKEIDTVYIGGGTPTVLEHVHLSRLLKLVYNQILSRFSILEYTVEAGRPDSLDSNKLQLMKAYGVTRLSINPQSMNQETLDLVGRSHTVEELVQVYHMANDIGFDCINMDVILGLPGETAEHMKRTMKGIASLKPENITVHTLAVKRASVYKESFHQYDSSREGLAEQMAIVCQEWIDNLGMKPYYLYRQKYMLDHLENIGYALPGKECLYNIQFMDERRDIWAFGAGASSKVYHPSEDRLERIGNVKNLEGYISRIYEMIERKQNAMQDS